MDNPQNDPVGELIRYFDGELTGEERATLENKLHLDAGMMEEYENLLLARAAITHYGYRQIVADVHKTFSGETLSISHKEFSSPKKIRYYLAAAAGIILLIGGFWMYRAFSLSPEEVFSRNYHVYSLNIPGSDSSGLTPVETAYSRANYREVIRIHDAGLDKTAKGEFLAGIAFLEKGNNQKAIKCFHEVLDLNSSQADPAFKEESEYYLALTYIRNKSLDEAISLLNAIATDNSHKYHEEVNSGLFEQAKKLGSR
ncbi:MAG: tetratricopeptide repeat protein [Chitinophagales bacterium]|nr:tetratricopeptide repeat protein [Chitinophagales bacterium]